MVFLVLIMKQYLYSTKCNQEVLPLEGKRTKVEKYKIQYNIKEKKQPLLVDTQSITIALVFLVFYSIYF